jgi:transcriptional regulator with XRE-family HTH domain
MDNNKFGMFITELRKEKKLTQKELGKELNISDKAISKWERGLSFPDISMLIPISNFFNISIVELLNGERTKENNLQKYNDNIVNSLNKNDKFYKRRHIIKIMSLLLIFIILYIGKFIVDYIVVFNNYERPPFSIQTFSRPETNNVGSISYENNYYGLFYDFKTLGYYKGNKYSITVADLYIGTYKFQSSGIGLSDYINFKLIAILIFIQIILFILVIFLIHRY